MINPNTLPTWIMQFGLSLLGPSVIMEFHNKEKSEHPNKDTPTGPSAEIRTQGLLNPIQARYQTSPHPEVFCWPSVSDSLVIIAYLQEKCKPFFRFFEIFS